MRFRGAIPDFQLANPLYKGAEVRFYLATLAGDATDVLASLYAGPVGVQTVNNPQTLDADGKFVRPVYISEPVVAVVVSANVDSHSTGVISPRGTYRGAWGTGLRFGSGDIITNVEGDNIYVVADDMIGGQSFGDDLIAGKFVFVLGMAVSQAIRDQVLAAAQIVADKTQLAAQYAEAAQNAAGSVDATLLNQRFLNIEQRATNLEKPNPFLVAQGLAYSGV